MQYGQTATEQVCFSWTLRQPSQRAKQKASQLNEGQANGWRPVYMMDRELSLRKNSGDDNRGQRHGETPNGSRGSAGLTCATNSLCDLHLRTDQMGQRVCLRRRAVFCVPSRLGGN